MLGVAAAVPVLAVAVLFPEPGHMPDTWDAIKPSLYASLGLIPALYSRPARLVRWGAVGSLVLVLLAPTWSRARSAATPSGSRCCGGCRCCSAYSPLPAFAVALVAFPLVWWAGRNVSRSCDDRVMPSASRSFYTPLLAELETRWDGTRRVEVIDPRTHWSSAYVAREDLPLARGWERQVDDARNPIFYGRAKLDAASYRTFLDEYAVGWVALPDAKLDFAVSGRGAAGEGRASAT